MLSLLGAVLVLLGVLGLLGLIGTTMLVEILLIAGGLALVAYDRGAFR